ncbi:transcriptional regulator [Pyxidicoccus xibeiensis]|uniref:transcriptional regulator n=1 Tax=Pyxidicoccus xibeiensis TaxID=2906759 RepID=UPI0020A77A4A|nr:transcriptional regulator [Pyxidicoccus xibeiensis]MCP3136159.1 transcriptional regulator [Pyxidicoccus xibeiensis]
MSAPVPPARGSTVRGALEAALVAAPEGGLTSKDLSGLVGISEKDVAEHLVHLEMSLKAQGLRLEVLPASCIGCGFAFKERKRLTRPGACPKCRSTRIDPPAFRVTS